MTGIAYRPNKLKLGRKNHWPAGNKIPCPKKSKENLFRQFDVGGFAENAAGLFLGSTRFFSRIIRKYTLPIAIGFLLGPLATQKLRAAPVKGIEEVVLKQENCGQLDPQIITGYFWHAPDSVRTGSVRAGVGGDYYESLGPVPEDTFTIKIFKGGNMIKSVKWCHDFDSAPTLYEDGVSFFIYRIEDAPEPGRCIKISNLNRPWWKKNN